jgi:hypothetical protein
VADVPSGFSLTPPQETKKEARLPDILGGPCLTGPGLSLFSMQVPSTYFWCLINATPSLHKSVPFPFGLSDRGPMSGLPKILCVFVSSALV